MAAQEELKECCECLEMYKDVNGVQLCKQHFACEPCIVLHVDMSIRGNTRFPPSCCTPIMFEVIQHLIDSYTREHWAARTKEIYAPSHEKVYCSNTDCRTFIGSEGIDKTQKHPVARCPRCSIRTCARCRQEWRDSSHDCTVQACAPSYLPPYSEEFRVKRCPVCQMWVTHSGACNHMECSNCCHSWCFVCLKPISFKCLGGEVTCPRYGDPQYDEENFENNARGLHRDTGYNRQGFDSWGLPRFAEFDNPDGQAEAQKSTTDRDDKNAEQRRQKDPEKDHWNWTVEELESTTEKKALTPDAEWTDGEHFLPEPPAGNQLQSKWN